MGAEQGCPPSLGRRDAPRLCTGRSLGPGPQSTSGVITDESWVGCGPPPPKEPSPISPGQTGLRGHHEQSPHGTLCQSQEKMGNVKGGVCGCYEQGRVGEWREKASIYKVASSPSSARERGPRHGPLLAPGLKDPRQHLSLGSGNRPCSARSGSRTETRTRPDQILTCCGR